MWSVNQQKGRAPMPKPKPLTPFVETMVRMHYGRRTFQWDRRSLGVLTSDGPDLCEAIQPATDEAGGTTTAPAVVCSDATDPFIPPPTREQLMAGSANARRVYKIET